MFTIDRNVGVEFFDHADNVQRPEYLIDHSPEAAGSAGRRVVTTSRPLTEIEAMMDRMLREHGLSQDSKRGTAVLRSLRTLSPLVRRQRRSRVPVEDSGARVHVHASHQLRSLLLNRSSRARRCSSNVEIKSNPIRWYSIPCSLTAFSVPLFSKSKINALRAAAGNVQGTPEIRAGSLNPRKIFQRLFCRRRLIDYHE